MSKASPPRTGTVNVKAAVVFAAICLAAVALVGLLQGLERLAGRCEGRGGHYMVGPAGETACIDRHTFLPMAVPDGRRN